MRRAGPFAVVVSDHNMPEMDGVTLLARMRDVAPRTVRILLTGQADVGLAIHAVDRGAIYRFVAKPCPPAEFVAILDAAIAEHHALAARERQPAAPRADGGRER